MKAAFGLTLILFWALGMWQAAQVERPRMIRTAQHLNPGWYHISFNFRSKEGAIVWVTWGDGKTERLFTVTSEPEQ